MIHPLRGRDQMGICRLLLQPDGQDKIICQRYRRVLRFVPLEPHQNFGRGNTGRIGVNLRQDAFEIAVRLQDAQHGAGNTIGECAGHLDCSLSASQEPEPYTLRSSRLGFSADQRLVFCTGHAKRGSSRVERR